MAIAFPSPTISGRPAELPPGLRAYAIGDVHGRDDLLAAKHALIRDDLRRRPVDQVVVVHVGDYVDRGPQSRQVIDRLIGLDRSDIGWVCLKGNHEFQMQGFLNDPMGRAEIWMVNGGGATLESYDVRPPRNVASEAEVMEAANAFRRNIPAAHVEFLHELALTYTIGDYFFCHAGVRPGIPLDRQEVQDLMWIRDEFLLSKEDLGRIVIHGHTPTDAPEVRSNRIGIDTMAVFSGNLTCLVLEGDGFVFL